MCLCLRAGLLLGIACIILYPLLNHIFFLRALRAGVKAVFCGREGPGLSRPFLRMKKQSMDPAAKQGKGQGMKPAFQSRSDDKGVP